MEVHSKYNTYEIYCSDVMKSIKELAFTKAYKVVRINTSMSLARCNGEMINLWKVKWNYCSYRGLYGHPVYEFLFYNIIQT
jgi:hypothetical protein